MRKPEILQLLTLLDDVRRLSHRVDHVSSEVMQNIARVEDLLNNLNQVSALQTVYEEKARRFTRQMNQLKKSPSTN